MSLKKAKEQKGSQLKSFNEKYFYNNQELNDFTKEKLIKLYKRAELKILENNNRIGFLERLINCLGHQGELKTKQSKHLLFKSEYCGIYMRLYKKFKTHPQTAAKIDNDKDFKLLKKFGSITKLWIGDDLKKKEKEGEIRSYNGHTKRYYRYLKELPTLDDFHLHKKKKTKKEKKNYK